MVVVYKGIDSIRLLLNIKAPLLIALGLLLLAWAHRQAGGFGPILSQPSAFAPGPAEGRAVLRVLLPGPDRHDRLLGDPLAQHSRLLPLRPHAAGPGPRPGARAAADDGALRLHRRRGHLGDDDHLRPDDLGPGRRADPVQESRCPGRSRCSRSASRHSPPTSRPTSSARPTTSPTLAPADLVPDRRAHHRADRHRDDALEADGRPLRLHLHLARRLQRAPRADRRHPDRRLLCLRGCRLDLRALYRSDGEYRYPGVSGWSLVAPSSSPSSRAFPGFLVQVQADPAAGAAGIPLGLYDYAWFAGFGIAFAVYFVLRRLAPRG